MYDSRGIIYGCRGVSFKIGYSLILWICDYSERSGWWRLFITLEIHRKDCNSNWNRQTKLTIT